MDEIVTESITDVDLDNPVLIEGLPGVGHVGKLAANHLIEQRDAELAYQLHSEHLPPQVTVDDDGTTSLAGIAFHTVELDGQDVIILTGDHQPQSNHGHYRVANAVLELADQLGVTTVYALGGVPTGELIEEYDVLGAATDQSLVESLTDTGVEFRSNEPAGGIVGISGLLLGLSSQHGLSAACLMGETSGYIVDPKSARAVLEILEDVLTFELDYTDLEERAERMEDVVGRIQEMESQQSAPAPTDDDLRYIG